MAKTLFITGAGAGIGAATARRFAREGWQLGLVDLDGEAVAALNEELGGQHWHRQLDVTDGDAVTTALSEFGTHAGGRLDLLFNCAGILKVGEFEDIDFEWHRRIMEINVIALMDVTRKAFPLLKATPGARVINMSSASALYGTPYFASYSASKFAVRGLTEALNLEWERHDIVVQDMMPPFVKTRMVAEQTFQAPIIERLGVNLEAKDIAEAVWRAARGKDVHNPVSLQFKSLVFGNKWLPNAFTRQLIGLLSKR
ncbi:SDR family oxidoreductase [Marinobacter bohaiensis]|uniref:SDR family oxidoreductase n=1 Tax=Marinobacter bohaiensis TaxID=2201898 RepID=UPI000DAC0483|nr:SDR family oxidoreductase [Marinobacter bohaiensis]